MLLIHQKKLFFDICKKCEVELNQKVLVIVSKKATIKVVDKKYENVELISFQI